LIREISGERKSTIDFADVMEFQCKKYKDVNGVTVFIDYYTMTFIRQKKVLFILLLFLSFFLSFFMDNSLPWNGIKMEWNGIKMEWNQNGVD
jgi:hypothetical protein